MSSINDCLQWQTHRPIGAPSTAILSKISRSVSGLATDSPCGFWGHGWTTFLQCGRPIFLNGLTLIPGWISKCMPRKAMDEIIYQIVITPGQKRRCPLHRQYNCIFVRSCNTHRKVSLCICRSKVRLWQFQGRQIQFSVGNNFPFALFGFMTTPYFCGYPWDKTALRWHFISDNKKHIPLYCAFEIQRLQISMKYP